MNLISPPVSLTAPGLVLEWQEGLVTDFGHRQQKIRLRFADLPDEANAHPKKINERRSAGRSRTGSIGQSVRFGVVALAALALAACKPSAPQSQPALPVNVVTVVEKDVNEWDEYTGRLDAVESVEVRPRVSGYITEVKFEAGAMVKAGDLLYVIDPRPYQADFDRAAAEFERTQANQKLAQIELDRAKDLRSKNTISASEFDQKAATYQQASAGARSAEAAKNAAALNLEFTQVKSPIAGRVSDARITLGNLVQPGAGPESVLTTVVSVDPIYVRIDADENSLLKYVKLDEEGKRKSARNGQIPAWVQLGNETDFPHEGVVDFVDNRLDPGTGTVRARVVLRNWSTLVVPGFFARIRVAGATPYRAALVADKVISSQQGLKYAYVVKPDNTLERRNLETGPIFEGKRIVKKGLKDGEKVVSTRLQLLQPGMPVTPISEQPPSIESKSAQ
ncbi:MAG TPA: efflux RND transporter periplasmic adaptor subunit [Chthoniobacterales bacterium]|nr:efflux RND transporter periplasmic adaptor subunit [Chthoniobacterales bacterium]